MTPEQAKAAFERVDETNEKMATRMSWPLWRHAAFGGLMALLLAAPALADDLKIIVLGLVVVALFAIIRDDKKRHGMFVSGYQKGRTIWILLATGVLFIAMFLGMNEWVQGGASDPLFWILTGAMFLSTTGLSYLWQIVYQADLRKGVA